jgi:hypothetical protein
MRRWRSLVVRDKHTLDAHSEYKRAGEAFVTHLACWTFVY